MDSKKCFKCGEVKPKSDFYKHPQMPDGTVNKCKECNKKDVREGRAARREQYSNYEAERNKTPARSAYRRRACDLHKARNPSKAKARNAVSNALRDGRLEKRPCEVCGSVVVEAHHDDYSKPLEVRWLCFRHHRETHGQFVVSDYKS